MTDTGEIVKMLRKRLNWTKVKLSEASGMSLDTIINVERHRNCKVDTFERLIEAMGYEMEILPRD